MFDNIPSLKDFIIYFIPGIILCYFTFDIFNYYRCGNLTTEIILQNSSLSFIGIIFSFVTGFIFSQIQIMVFNHCYRNVFRKMRTIESTQKRNTEIQNTLINRIKTQFDIVGNNIENDDLIVFLCLNFVKIKTNQESNLYIERNNNLSNFAISLFLPILTAIWSLMLQMRYTNNTTIGIMLIISIFLYILIKRIAINFKDDYYKNIFRQFIVLNENNIN